RLGPGWLTLGCRWHREASSAGPELRLPSVAPASPLSSNLLALALRDEPKLKVLALESKQAAASAELTRKTRLPDVSLGVEGRQYSGDGEFRSGMFTIRFSLPFANRDKYQKDYEPDEERQKSAEQDRADTVLMGRAESHH